MTIPERDYRAVWNRLKNFYGDIARYDFANYLQTGELPIASEVQTNLFPLLIVKNHTIVYDSGRQYLLDNDKNVQSLPKISAAMFLVLLRHPEEPQSHETLEQFAYQQVGSEHDSKSYVWVNISRLRIKLREMNKNLAGIIKTVPEGYVYKPHRSVRIK